jgi:hypothetical protein
MGDRRSTRYRKQGVLQKLDVGAQTIYSPWFKSLMINRISFIARGLNRGL